MLYDKKHLNHNTRLYIYRSIKISEAKLSGFNRERVHVIEGDATDETSVEAALKDVDIVFVTSTGETLGQ